MRVRGSWRLNKDCNILTSPAPPDVAVCHSRSPDVQPEDRGLRFLLAFSTTSHLYLITPTHWLPVFTELYNSSIAHSIAHSIFGMAYLIVIKRKKLSCSSEVTLFRCISLWVYHGLLPCPISSAKSAYAISFDYWPLECVTSFRCITSEWHVWPGRRSIYNINPCRLSKTKSRSYKYIKYIWFGLVLWHIIRMVRERESQRNPSMQNMMMMIYIYFLCVCL